jgi:hypothetical protein
MMICVTIDLVWFEAALFYGWGEKDEIPWELWQDFGSNTVIDFNMARRSARDGFFHMQSGPESATPLWRCCFQGRSMTH